VNMSMSPARGIEKYMAPSLCKKHLTKSEACLSCQWDRNSDVSAIAIFGTELEFS
jgi:hypothetical protein